MTDDVQVVVPEGATSLVLGPEDVLILRVPDDELTPEGAKRIIEACPERLRGRVLVVSPSVGLETAVGILRPIIAEAVVAELRRLSEIPDPT